MGDSSAVPPLWFRILLVVTIVAIYGLIVLGGYVKASGAGLACPDWPTCEGGEVFSYTDSPPDSAHLVAVEVTHRVAASFIVGPLVLGSTAAAFWLRLRGGIAELAALSLVVLVVQVYVGGVTVTSLLQPMVVTAHLALATGFFALWLVIGVLAFRQAATASPAVTADPMPSGSGSARPAVAKHGTDEEA